MSRFIYTWPQDNVLVKPGVIATVQIGLEDPVYPATYINNERPEKPAKLTTTSGAWSADLLTAQRVDVVAIIHHNFDAYTDVRFQMSDTPTWLAPKVDLPFAVPTRYQDGFTVNVWLDLTQLVVDIPTRTARYLRLVQNSVNSAPLSVGEWVAYRFKRDLGIRGISYGAIRGLRRPAIIQETETLVRRMLIYGNTVRTLSCQVNSTMGDQLAIEEWFRAAQGVGRPFLIVPNSDDIDSMLAGFHDDLVGFTRAHQQSNMATLNFQEWSRGLYP